MRTRANAAGLAMVALTAGCWDFDALRRAPQDFGNADLAPSDFAPMPDLSCVLPTAPNIFYVAKSAPAGGDGSSARPYQTIGGALANPSSATLFVTGGVYPESVTISKNIAIYGGFTDATFACRSKTTPTIISSPASPSPAVSVSMNVVDATLDNLTLYGASASTATALALDVSGKVSLVDCVVQSQPTLTSAVSDATGSFSHHGSTLTALRTSFIAGSGNNMDSAAMGNNSGTVKLTDCRVTVANSSTAYTAYGIGSHAPDTRFDASTTLTRTLVTSSNAGRAIGILATAQNALNTTQLEGSAVVATTNQTAYAIQLDQSSAYLSMLKVHLSTLSVPKLTGTGAALRNTASPVDVTVSDSILAGPYALHTMYDLSSSYHAMGNNLLFSQQMSGVVVDQNAALLSFSVYQSRFADSTATWGNPFFQTDGYNLATTGSAAAGKASMCDVNLTVDLDGDPRPGRGRTSCDIGADEH